MGFDKWKSWKWLNMHEAHKHAHMDQPDKIRKAREKNHNSTLYCCLPLLDEMSVMLGFNSDNNVVCENFWFYPWKSFFCSRFHFLSAVISHFVRSKLVWVVVSSQTSFFSVEGGISSHPYLKAKFKFCWAFSCRASETINSRHAIECWQIDLTSNWIEYWSVYFGQNTNQSCLLWCFYISRCVSLSL